MPKSIQWLLGGLMFVPTSVVAFAFGLTAFAFHGQADVTNSKYDPIILAALATYMVAVWLVWLALDALCYYLKQDRRMALHHALWVVGITMTYAGTALYLTNTGGSWAYPIGISGLFIFMWQDLDPKYTAVKANRTRMWGLSSATTVGWYGVSTLRTIGLPSFAMSPLMALALLGCIPLLWIMWTHFSLEACFPKQET